MPPISFRPHRCNVCNKLVVKGTHANNQEGFEYLAPDVNRDKIVFGFTFADLKSGVAQGCALCEWILSSKAISRHGYLDSKLATIDLESSIDVSTYEALCFVLDKSLDHQRSSLLEAASEGGGEAENYILVAKTSPPFNIGIGYMSDLHQIDYFGLWDSISKTIKCLTIRGLQFFAEPSDPMTRDVSTRPIESDPASSLPIINDWLAECRSNHSECRSAAQSLHRSSAKPTRLLCIDTSGSETRVFIQETEGITTVPQYVALSYCWGGDQPVKCTMSTLSKFRISIPLESLPQTLKDAIKICLDLGYQYIWIDALCIVQDDDIDKSSEIAKMPLIYGGAAFTVAASRATSVEQGFLHTRISDSDGRAAFSLPSISSTGEAGTLTIVDIGTNPEPIDSRGWTFQERLLSTRIVEFGSRQTRWSCREDSYWDGMTDGWRQIAERSVTTPNPSNLKVALSNPEDVEIQLWYHLVEIYTERNLTQMSDRPLAVSGVAEWVGSLLKDEYAAGMWKSHIYTGLLWAVEAKNRCRRPEKFQGPSWSWLSVASPVWFHYIYYQNWPAENIKINVLSISCTLANQIAPFGAIREDSGLLTLEGKLAHAKVRHLVNQTPIGNDAGGNDHEVEIFGHGDKGPSSGLASFHPDSDEVVEMLKVNEPDILALEILNMHQGPTWSSYGLIVLRLEHSEMGLRPKFPTFSRLGTFVFEVNDENCQQDDESDEDWEKRIDEDFNWFKHLKKSTLIVK